MHAKGISNGVTHAALLPRATTGNRSSQSAEERSATGQWARRPRPPPRDAHAAAKYPPGAVTAFFASLLSPPSPSSSSSSLSSLLLVVAPVQPAAAFRLEGGAGHGRAKSLFAVVVRGGAGRDGPFPRRRRGQELQRPRYVTRDARLLFLLPTVFISVVPAVSCP